MRPAGLLLMIVGTLILSQVLAGNALGRMGITSASGPGITVPPLVTPPGTGTQNPPDVPQVVPPGPQYGGLLGPIIGGLGPI